MNTESPLLREVRELRLLAGGLSRVEAFPSELLTLMVAKIDHLEALLAGVSTEPTPSVDSAVSIEPSVAVEPVRTDDADKRFERIRVSLTLNDRFLFQRELFGNDPQGMALFFKELSLLSSRTQAEALLQGTCPGREQTEGFQTLTALLEQWFPAHSGLV